VSGAAWFVLGAVTASLIWLVGAAVLFDLIGSPRRRP
jgi:arginine exporter protein ArgO